MIAVIFEVEPKEGLTQSYLDHAAILKPTLEKMDGFISVERFESLAQPGKYLSLSFWRDEEAVMGWRNTPEHRHTKGIGRKHTFANYRLRVASVVRDYGMNERAEDPNDSRKAHQA